MYETFDAIPDYQAEADTNNADKHGLEVGDVISAGMGPDVEVLEIADEGVRFDDGTCASHMTVASNMSDLGLI